jgi:hypothetical protein
MNHSPPRSRRCASSSNARPWSRVVTTAAAAVCVWQKCVHAAEYGVDVSFPIHHAEVSDNYDWLPHNQDPSLPVPEEYRDKPVQTLGNRQQFYDDFIAGCVQHFGKKGHMCYNNEQDRIEMALRQPQSMQVSIYNETCCHIRESLFLFQCANV